MSVEIIVKTNMDVREEWPSTVAYPPREGEWIQAESGLQYQINRIIHFTMTDLLEPAVILYVLQPGNMPDH